jgi:FtsH-binding integral membrane protein
VKCGEVGFIGMSPPAANIDLVKTGTRGLIGILADWLAWGRRSWPNRVLFVATLSLAASVTGAFAWATIRPYPGDFARYFAYYWVWGLCAVALLLGMAEYKTSPLRKGRERGHLLLLLYVGALLIITRALNMLLYGS